VSRKFTSPFVIRRQMTSLFVLSPIRSERKGSLVGWIGAKAVLGVLEFRRRREKEFTLEDAFRSPFFYSFFGSLEACMGRSRCSGYPFPLFFAPSRDRRLAYFSSERPVVYLFRVRCYYLYHRSLLFSSSLSFSFLSLSLSVSIFSLRRYNPPIRFMG
jgi:hypothetical protein